MVSNGGRQPLRSKDLKIAGLKWTANSCQTFLYEID